MKFKRGFSLLELVLAVAVFSLSSFAIATLMIDSSISTKLSSERNEALSYAKEGIEATRSIRNNSWASLTPGTYGLVSDDSGWSFVESFDLIDDKYRRVIEIADIIQDSISARSVRVSVSWDLTPSRTASTTLNTILTNWKNN
jgi:prepilin-type N-terminal cleavage/methylation domain-containing protein